MIFPIGFMVISQTGAWVVPVWGWKTMFLIGGIPGLIITWLLLRLPESPRWLISKGRFGEAELIVKQIEAWSRSETGQSNALPPAPAETPIQFQSERGGWADVLAPVFRARTLTV